MFFCQHESSKLISLIRKELEPDELFDAEAYKEFKRRLTPSVFFKEQIKPIPLSIKQKRLSESKIGPERITGVAGSGKTTVMAVRAINALKRHEGRVLILTFNITLTTLIRDVFSKLLNTRNLAGIYILHYHMFLMAVMNDNNIPTHGVFDEEFSNEECIPHSPLFSGHESAIEKFDSILIDETQDFCKEWIETLKQLFLKDDGEIVLFGDDLQGIYKRNSNIKESYLIRGFGKRERLTSSFRTKVDSPLISLFGEFQSAHPHDDVDSFDKVKKDEVAQQSLDVDVIAHKTLAKNVDVAEAAKLVKSLYQKLNFIPNDTVVLASNIQFLINLEDKLGPPEKFMTTFESKEQLDAMRKWEADFSDLEIKKIRKRKKYHFQLNSGKLKLATVHSFKGLEAENVIYFLNSSDSPELVFTAISRARRNLLVLEIGNTNYHEFFASRTEKLG
jgi:superfamily I DNA/RNA helicase